MKICFICTDPGIPIFGRKGCSTHVRETCLTLIDLGHEVRLICSNTDGDDTGRDRIQINKAQPFRSRKLGFDLRHLLLDRRIERVAREVIETWKPDALYERYSLYSRAGTKLARRYRLPHLLEINALMTKEQRNRIKLMPLARRYERKIFVEARQVVVVSEPLRRDISLLRSGDETIVRMPMAVNLKRFNPSVDGSSVRQALGLGDKFVLGYVGTLTAWHGIALLYDFARELKKTGVNNYLILIVGGDEKRLTHHRAKVKTEGLQDILRFHGPVPHVEVPRFIRAMDVALIPDTTYWSSPAKLFEYQGCGIPVLAPRYPAVENAMTHGAEGLLFEPKNIPDMAENAALLYRDRDLRQRLGHQARQRASHDHSWEDLGRSVITLFQDQASQLRD